MGNVLQMVKPSRTNDDLTEAKPQCLTEKDETYQINQTLMTIDSIKPKTTYAELAQESIRTAIMDTISERNGPKVTTTFSDLPVELLAMVVRQVGIRQWKRLQLVNRKFRTAVLMVWKDLRSLRLESLFGYDDITCDFKALEWGVFLERNRLQKCLETVVIRSPMITEYKGIVFLESQFTSLVVKHLCRMKNLERLHLYRLECSAEDEAMVRFTIDLCQRYHPLRHTMFRYNEELSRTLQAALSQMTLRELVYRSTNDDKGKCLLEMNCDQLTTLDLACSEIDFDVLYQLLVRCTNLTHLNLSATQRKPVALPEKNFFTWLRTAKSLVSLKLNYFLDSDSIYSRSWQSALHWSLLDLGTFQVLTELDMMDFRYCSDATITVITQRFAKSLKILRLDIGQCSEDALLRLTGKMVNLEQLRFWSHESAAYNPNVRNNISDKVVSEITSNLVNLSSLNLSRTSASANALKSLIKLKNLRLLAVTNAFDDESLIIVASALGHQLTSLEIPRTSQISDEGMVIAATHLRTLRHLDLEHAQISDRSLTALARFCPELRIVVLENCCNISSKGALVIVTSCPKMERLYLYGSPVNESDLKKCNRLQRAVLQATEYDTLCIDFLWEFPDYRRSSSSRKYWYRFYCAGHWKWMT